MGPAAGLIAPSAPSHQRRVGNQPGAYRPAPEARPAGSPRGRKSCRLQQANNLAEKRQVDARIGAQHGTADLDLDRRGAGRNSAFRHDWYKVRHGNAGTGKRASPQLPTPHVKLIAVQPVAQRNRARHRSRRQALRDNRRLLRRTPASPPRRSRQNLNTTETVPINWQITWQTSLPASTEQGRIIPSPSAPAICEQRLPNDDPGRFGGAGMAGSWPERHAPRHERAGFAGAAGTGLRSARW